MVILGVILTVAGGAVGLYGLFSSFSIENQLSTAFDGGNSGTIFLVIGVIALIIGIILIVVGKKNKKM